MHNKEDMFTSTHNEYYGSLEVEPIDIIKSLGLTFHTGNIVKYVLRAGNKPGESAYKDLKKALWYIDDIPDDEFTRHSYFIKDVEILQKFPDKWKPVLDYISYLKITMSGSHENIYKVKARELIHIEMLKARHNNIYTKENI